MKIKKILFSLFILAKAKGLENMSKGKLLILLLYPHAFCNQCVVFHSGTAEAKHLTITLDLI